MRSDEGVAPGFVHDEFSRFYPLAAVSPVVRGLGLEAFGLRWRHAPAVLGHPLPDGSWATLHRDVEATAAGLEARRHRRPRAVPRLLLGPLAAARTGRL